MAVDLRYNNLPDSGSASTPSLHPLHPTWRRHDNGPPVLVHMDYWGPEAPLLVVGHNCCSKGISVLMV
jgi:hypothetical protein